jgi:hypothetical protein
MVSPEHVLISPREMSIKESNDMGYSWQDGWSRGRAAPGGAGCMGTLLLGRVK